MKKLMCFIFVGLILSGCSTAKTNEKKRFEPCGISLKSISKAAGSPGDTIELFGQWGDSQGEKLPLINKGKSHDLEVISWSNSIIKAKIPQDLDAGVYRVGVYCNDLSKGGTYGTVFNEFEILSAQPQGQIILLPPSSSFYWSFDGGKSYSQMSNEGSTGFSLVDFSVNPARQGTVVGLSSEGGLFKTEDNGKTWEKVLNLPSAKGTEGVSLFYSSTGRLFVYLKNATLFSVDIEKAVMTKIESETDQTWYVHQLQNGDILRFGKFSGEEALLISHDDGSSWEKYFKDFRGYFFVTRRGTVLIYGGPHGQRVAGATISDLTENGLWVLEELPSGAIFAHTSNPGRYLISRDDGVSWSELFEKGEVENFLVRPGKALILIDDEGGELKKWRPENDRREEKEKYVVFCSVNTNSRGKISPPSCWARENPQHESILSWEKSCGWEGRRLYDGPIILKEEFETGRKLIGYGTGVYLSLDGGLNWKQVTRVNNSIQKIEKLGNYVYVLGVDYPDI